MPASDLRRLLYASYVGPGLVLLDRKAAQGCGMSAVERAACRPLRSLPRAILALTLIYRLTVTPM